jgi:hypothetical protein
MAIDNASKMKAKNKTMDVNEKNYVIGTLKDMEKQLRMEQDEPTGTA